MNDIPLPTDIFTYDGDDASIWATLQEQSATAIANRTDLVGRIALEERAKVNLGWRERVQNRISQEGHEPVGLKVISDASKIFDLFRLGDGYGLGWSRDMIAAAPQSKLRVFAQNAAWSLTHRERVEEMMNSSMAENHIRKAINESRRQEAIESGEETDAQVWETIPLRLDSRQAAWVRGLLAGVRFKAQQYGEEFSSHQAVADGHAAMLALLEWYEGGDTVDDGEGGTVFISNSVYIDPEIQAEIARQEAEAVDGTEAVEHGVEAEGGEEAAD